MDTSVAVMPSDVCFTFISSFCFRWSSLLYSHLSAHDKLYNKSSMASKDADQPVFPPSMARVLVYPSLDSRRLWKAHAISDDSDQTARMRRLVWVFAGRTRLSCNYNLTGALVGLFFMIRPFLANSIFSFLAFSDNAVPVINSSLI